MAKSRFGKVFARTAGANMARCMGNFQRGDVTYIDLAGNETPLRFVVMGDERRKWENVDRGGMDLHYIREGWLMTDPASPQYAGTQTLQIGGTIIDDGVRYSIDEASVRDYVIDFRVKRAAPIEKARQDFRGRA